MNDPDRRDKDVMRFLRSISLLMVLLVCNVSGVLAQKTVYVSADGNILGTGSFENPFANLTAAFANVAAGDTIYIRGGAYRSSGAIRIDKSGEENNYLHIWAYPGESPVFDFTGAPRGFDIRGNYLHIKGVVAEKAEDNGIYAKQASYNIIEQAVARLNGDSGVQVEDGSSHNLLLNIDSYNNYDPGNNGENADGFAIKFGVGPGNVLRGCRAWGNSDDGFDFWSRDDPGHNGVIVESSWSFANGHNVWGDPDFRGDSNGFKLGHGPGAHMLTGNLAWGHLAHGFDVNGNTSGVTLYNNTGFQNEGANFYFDHDTNVAQAPAILRNNLSYGDVRMDQSIVDDVSNSWNVGIASITESDFLSIDDTGADGPRQADGSLPALDFLHLASGSALVDAVVEVGLPFAGSRPDLGAYEIGLESITSVESPETPDVRIVLAQNYPNPFTTLTHFVFEVQQAAPVRLAVYDVLGRSVAVLFDGMAPAGRHNATWNLTGRVLPGGVYFVRMEAAGAVEVRRMVLLK